MTIVFGYWQQYEVNIHQEINNSILIHFWKVFNRSPTSGVIRSFLDASGTNKPEYRKLMKSNLFKFLNVRYNPLFFPSILE